MLQQQQTNEMEQKLRSTTSFILYLVIKAHLRSII